MKIHAVVGLGQSQIKIKDTICYCEKCLTGDIYNTWRAEGMRNTPSVQASVPGIESNSNTTDEVSADYPRNTVTLFKVGQYVAGGMLEHL